jgi:uncharacterized protein YndB with AHSA1/START domain
MHFETTVEIDAPRDAVWSTLADVDRWPEWTASVTWAQRLSGSGWAPGTRVRIKQPRIPALVWEITEIEPGESFTWRASSAGVRAVGTHQLRVIAANRVAVTLGIRESGPLAPVIGLLTSGRSRRYVQTEATGLKQHCERQHPAT